MDIDSAFRALITYRKHLTEYLAIPLSESDTRAKFIDVFIKDVLGWDEVNIRREHTYWTEEERAAIDYELRITSPILLIEAKRLAKRFELPTATGSALYALDGVVQSRPVLWDAILQARRYCDDCGFPFALVTNGEEFALFRAITTGYPWKQGKLLVFTLSTLEYKHFADVFMALARDHITPTGLDTLLGVVRQTHNANRIADIVGPHTGRVCNAMNDVMQQAFSEVLLDPLTPSESFLRDCYCTDKATHYYSKSLESLLKDPLPPFAARVQKVKPGARKDPFTIALDANLNRTGPRPPICVIGGPGVGKTMFLQWFFRASAYRQSLENAILLWIDFRQDYWQTHELKDRVYAALIEQLEANTVLAMKGYSTLKAVFADRLKKEEQFVLLAYANDPTQHDQKVADCIERWRADRELYLNALLRYAASQVHRNVVIVLDNIDQKKPDTQYALYEISQALANSHPLTVLLSMRESTFYQGRQSPVINAFSQQQIFHIRSPNLAPLLAQRFDYLQKQLDGRALAITSAKGHTLQIEDIADFLGLLRRSMVEGPAAEDNLKLVECIANGNVRNALNLLYSFLVSGHTKLEEYFWQYAKRQTSYIPFHEFMASLMLNEMSFFTEENSQYFLNIFSRQPNTFDSHFTRLRLLRLAESMSHGEALRAEDFVPLDQLRAPFLKAGMTEGLLNKHLASLIRFGLLMSDTQVNEDKELSFVSTVHLTAAGKYYLDNLSSHFQYVLRIIPDTSVEDSTTYGHLYALYESRRNSDLLLPVKESVSAVRIFLSYLENQEYRELQESSLTRIPELKDISFMPAIIAGVEATMKRISEHTH